MRAEEENKVSTKGIKKRKVKGKGGKYRDQNLSSFFYLSTRMFFLAHLSRRLIGELIEYPCSGVRCRRPPFSNAFSSETAWPIKYKFYVEPPLEGGTKVCINGPGHMTKMAAMPIYGKNLLYK